MHKKFELSKFKIKPVEAHLKFESTIRDHVGLFIRRAEVNTKGFPNTSLYRQ